MENQIQILKKGVEFLIDTSNRAAQETMHVKFCHKDDMGYFQNGITSEGLMQVLISRYQYLVEKDSSIENKRVLLFLNQAYDSIKTRKALKQLMKDEYKRNGLP